MGDLNIHHSRWLRFSTANTGEEKELQEICANVGLMQLVKEPNIILQLLDLCLTDIHGTKVQMLPKVADHNALLVTLAYETPRLIEMPGKVWHFKGAAWPNLKCALREVNWQDLHKDKPNDAVNLFTSTLMSL